MCICFYWNIVYRVAFSDTLAVHSENPTQVSSIMHRLLQDARVSCFWSILCLNIPKISPTISLTADLWPVMHLTRQIERFKLMDVVNISPVNTSLKEIAICFHVCPRSSGGNKVKMEVIVSGLGTKVKRREAKRWMWYIYPSHPSFLPLSSHRQALITDYDV